MWLMQALGFLLSALQVEEILKNLHSLITPYIQQLEKLADETVSHLPGEGRLSTFKERQSLLCARVLSSLLPGVSSP